MPQPKKRDDAKPPKKHWLKWAGKKPLKMYPWSLSGYWWKAGARAMVELFKRKGILIQTDIEEVIHTAWAEHMQTCEPKLVKEWEK